jgi:hypothetical protein
MGVEIPGVVTFAGFVGLSVPRFTARFTPCVETGWRLTVPGNLRSRRVMESIGMVHDPAEDFDHPALPEGHRLRRHTLRRRSYK